MRVLFVASHLLHHRVLIPVAKELARRGHTITWKTTRPPWFGLPRRQMLYDCQKVTAINKAGISWLAEQILHEKACNFTHTHVCSLVARPADHDVVVSTIKDLDRLRATEKPWVAIGYQHLPVVLTPSRCTFIDASLPYVFYAHPFAELHKFVNVMRGCHVRPCGFPHLDGLRCPPVQSSRTVLIIHPGGYRGIDGHEWLRETVCLIQNEGYEVIVAAHPVGGKGYEPEDLQKALCDLGVKVVRGWWSQGRDASLILATGSSSMYELWAVGLTNGYILTYPGGKRHEKFAMFQDITMNTSEELKTLLRRKPKGYECESVTSEVAEAYRKVHDGKGTERACNVIEEAGG